MLSNIVLHKHICCLVLFAFLIYSHLSLLFVTNVQTQEPQHFDGELKLNIVKILYSIWFSIYIILSLSLRFFSAIKKLNSLYTISKPNMCQTNIGLIRCDMHSLFLMFTILNKLVVSAFSFFHVCILNFCN